MNGVDRSDQLIGTNNVMHKCFRWWKTMFFQLIEIEVIRQICAFPEYADPPVAGKRPTPTSVFDSIHVPVFSDSRRRCVVCYKQGRGEMNVYSYCSAPQCGNYLHVTREKNCFFGTA